MFVIGAGVDLFLAGVIFSVYFFKSIPECRRAFFPFRTPKILSTLSFLFSIKLSIAALVFFQLLLRVDQLILATLSNAYTLGIYSAAVKISDIPNFLVGIISMALTSRISQISVKYDNESRKNLKYVMIYYIAVGIFISACIVVFAPLAVHVLYGTKFIDSVSVLRVYALSIPAIFLVSFFMSIYGARDKYKQQVIIFGSSLALNVFLIYVLTPFYGILGTAFATVVAYYFAAICLYAGAEKSSAKALKEDV